MVFAIYKCLKNRAVDVARTVSHLAGKISRLIKELAPILSGAGSILFCLLTLLSSFLMWAANNL